MPQKSAQRSVILQAPAKINLYLGVCPLSAGAAPDGRHLVKNLMVPLSLADKICVEPAGKPGLFVNFDPPLSISAEKTNVYKGAFNLAQALGVDLSVRGVCIRVSRSIPERSGLGGSSADAGGVLRALVRLWGAEVGCERACAAAQSVSKNLGADVPFFLDPDCSLWEGAGDILLRRLSCPKLQLALVMPAETGPLTAEVYRAFDCSGDADPLPFSVSGSPDKLLAALSAPDCTPRDLALLVHNDLALAACGLHEKTAAVLSWLRCQEHVLAAELSGSGSCSYAICESRAAAESIAAAARAQLWRAWSAQSL